MGKASGSSQRWLMRWRRDPYVKRAQQDAYRSRAAYKLLELQNKYKLLRPGMNVVELGAAPGSWTQVVAEIIGSKGRLVALDILAIPAFLEYENVTILQGDFTDPLVAEHLLSLMVGQANVILSDMAANFSGISNIDAANAVYLAELVLGFAPTVLVVGGSMVVKLFQGSGFEAIVAKLRENFGKVFLCKPDASRKESAEMYAVATAYKGKGEL
jgi:23S rRNA (uridine2552-2'-O)-methyltransferase